MSTQPDALTAERQYTTEEHDRVHAMILACEHGGFSPGSWETLRRMYGRDCRMLLAALTAAQQERDRALAERDELRQHIETLEARYVPSSAWVSHLWLDASPPAPTAGRENGEQMEVGS